MTKTYQPTKEVVDQQILFLSKESSDFKDSNTTASGLLQLIWMI